MALNRHIKDRRGVLLLIVLALLALFGVTAVGFYIVATSGKRSADATVRTAQNTERPDNLLNEALAQVLRGTNNTQSAIGPHSLLEDMYGNNTLTGEITSSPQPIAPTYNTSGEVTEGQINEIPCSVKDADGNVKDIRDRVGCVLTFISGRSKGRSTRIIGYSPTTGHIQVLVNGWRLLGADGKPGNGGSNLSEVGATDTDDELQINDRFVVNGTPFSGTGFGFNSTSNLLDAQDGTYEVALLPKHPANLTSLGGANEDYDAPDYQNMLLALRDPSTGKVPIPSLHRPELVNYWMNRATDWSTNLTLQRQVILRPNTNDHFETGVPEKAFNPLGPTWDVDNDGDSITDSVWVDLGFPPRATTDGRLYKPLFAILCTDLDGRLNVNAHGSVEQTQASYYSATDTTADTLDSSAFAGGPSTALEATPLTSATLARGQGFGPADINLRPLFRDRSDDAIVHNTQYQRLLCGLSSESLNGRYGEVTETSPRSGATGAVCYPFVNKFFDHPASFANTNAYGIYRSPSDMRGILSVGLDLYGQPLYAMMSGTWGNLAIDNPYRINLTQTTSVDAPFSLIELERFLRPFDVDSSSRPNRLARLTFTDLSKTDISNSCLYQRRHEFTTDSWDLPCPNIAGIPDLRSKCGDKPPEHLRRLLLTNPDYARALLPPELRAGLRMNLNRRFGNGSDDNGDGVIDDPDELLTDAASAETMSYKTAGGGNVTTKLDQDNDETKGATIDPRQLYARHLYVLMLSLIDRSYVDTITGSPNATAKLVAQWAVNVVDFRDADSIMTRFAYDTNPFDGWSPTEVVWGCERPELLISETLAFHDRRTEDLSNFGYAKPPTPGDPKEEQTGDNIKDLDQRYRPEGSLFVELYNPWTATEPRPAEFYDTVTGGVDLARVTPDRHAVQSPVWRLKIVVPATNPEDEPDPDDAAAERTVYFCDQGMMDTNTKIHLPGDANIEYRPSSAAKIGGKILPGRYAVIGPGMHPDCGGSTTTYIGFRNGFGSGDNDTRRIVLDPGGSPQVQVLNDTGTIIPTAPNPIAIVIDGPKDPNNSQHPMRLSVSEPVDGYAQHLVGVTYNPSNGQYSVIQDKPVDSRSTDWNDVLGKDRTTARYRIVHLQRLANPLLPYDATTNPYRTIDSMSVDLTCFNGVTNSTSNPDYQAPGIVGDPGTPLNPNPKDVMFYARQRGEHNFAEDPQEATFAADYNLWKQEPFTREITADNTTGAVAHNFSKRLKQSLGYVNYEYFAPRTTPAGCPKKPYPWLTWLNRPFVNPFELMLVPALSASKLLSYDYTPRANVADTRQYHHSYRIRKAGEEAYEQYRFDAVDAPQKCPFPHLLNFFHTDDPAHSNKAPRWYRLFEFVQTPSPFLGVETFRSPDPNADNGSHEFHAPFLEISGYREPGRINLNTIFSRDVLAGLLNRTNLTPNTADPSLWQRFVQSRRGYGALAEGIVTFDDNYPTCFVNPFRSFSGYYSVPLVNMQTQIGSEINATVLRANTLAADGSLLIPPNAGTQHESQYALFQPMIPDANESNYNNTNRNPFFRYQDVMRLSNLVTTRSNVYAVWITVGYFEVEYNSDTTKFPDNYRLTQELGSDTGEVERHRAFFIIDRSIPVGFKRGEDLNSGNCVLLKRFIE